MEIVFRAYIDLLSWVTLIVAVIAYLTISA
jgi:hypothetical protein